MVNKRKSAAGGRTSPPLCSDDPRFKAIEMLKRHDFTEGQAKNILRSVCADTPEKLMEAADRLIEYCARASGVWGVVSAIAEGFVHVSYDERGMMMHLTEKGIAEGAKLTKEDASLPEIPK